MVLPDGEKAINILAQHPQTMDFIKDQYLHYKSILVLGSSKKLLDKVGIDYETLNETEHHGLIVRPADKADEAIKTFISALAVQRHWHRNAVLQ